MEVEDICFDPMEEAMLENAFYLRTSNQYSPNLNH